MMRYAQRSHLPPHFRIRDLDVVVEDLVCVGVVQQALVHLGFTAAPRAHQLGDHDEQVADELLLQQRVLGGDLHHGGGLCVLHVDELPVVQLLEQQEALLVRQHLLVRVFDHVLGMTKRRRAYGGHLVDAHGLHLARDGLDELLHLVLRAVAQQRDHQEAAVLGLAQRHHGLHDFLHVTELCIAAPLKSRSAARACRIYTGFG